MRGLLLTVLLLGCADSTLPLYWTGPGPSLDGHSPLSTDSLLGGETLTLTGSGLTDTRTVVVGGRNAEIISTCDEAVEVLLPKGTPGGGLVDITVVTDQGQATMEDCFEYASPGAALWANEIASISIYQYHCPIELWTFNEDGDWSELWWCGFEGGYADAYGFDGASPQPGFASELMGFAGVSGLPPAGEARLIAPGERLQPMPPLIYGVHPDDETYHVVAERDFSRDLAYIEDLLQTIEETYLWWDSVADTRPMAWLFGEDECFTEAIEVTDYDWDSLFLDGSADGAIGVHLGIEIDEVYGDWGDFETYSYGVPTGSADVCAFDDEVVADDSGVVLRYDGWSGYFFADTIGGSLLPSDVPPSARYQISHTRLGETQELGVVRGVEKLELISPTLMTGNLQVDYDDEAPLVHNIGYMQSILGLDGSLSVEWEPGADSDEGTFISIELVYYDASQDDPMWMTEIGRIVAHGVDAEGTATLPVDQLLNLPEAPNLVDFNDDMIGVWAELTIARHQMRVLNLDEGDLVVDFVDVYSSPLSIYHPE